ncbi:MAG: hypothetical protein DMG14_13360 [Acidobacteria bacterium]|nr:MAG: hypothetical protein DMG14_13360 [Acidobacteriota bacterium]
MTMTAIQSDSAWLRIPDYEITALNPKLAGRVPELKGALESGLPAYPDASRENFYDVELPTGWAYIHVRDEKQVVYLIAYSRIQFGNAG